MQTIKTQVPAHTDTSITPADQFRVVISAGKAVAEASRYMVASIIGYLLNVSHFRDNKDKEYLSKSSALEFLSVQICKQADLSEKMVNIYTGLADDLYSRMVKGKMFLPVVQDCSKCTDPVKVADRLFKWIEQDWKAKSLSDLRQALGYSVGKRTGGSAGQKKTTTEKVATLQTSVASIEKLVADPKSKVQPSQVHTAMAKAVTDPLDLAMQAIRQYASRPDADPDKLEAVIKTITKVVDELEKRLAKQAKVHKATLDRSAKNTAHIERALDKRLAKAKIAALAKAKGGSTSTGAAVHAPQMD